MTPRSTTSHRLSRRALIRTTSVGIGVAAGGAALSRSVQRRRPGSPAKGGDALGRIADAPGAALLRGWCSTAERAHGLGAIGVST